jgi:hypothetical protein
MHSDQQPYSFEKGKQFMKKNSSVSIGFVSFGAAIRPRPQSLQKRPVQPTSKVASRNTDQLQGDHMIVELKEPTAYTKWVLLS